jgi:hypothetical protein
VFVGRDRELSTFTSAFSRLTEGGGVVLIAGEPGIGKTRLASEAAGVARKSGLRVTWGRCWEAGGAPVFWPWREALEACGIAFPDATAVVSSDPNTARFSLFREVATAVGRESSGQPIVIVLEDLHAADQSTLLLLEFLAGSLRALPVLIIGTYRDLEARSRAEVGDILTRVGRSGEVLHLSRLGPADVEALLRDAVPGANQSLAATIHDITQGNPLFVDEMVREVRARGQGEELPIPLGVREIIRQRLALVSSDARTVLEAAAVLGVEMSETVLQRMVQDHSQALDDVARTGLITVRGDRLRFSHALYREALYHELPRLRRQELHREAALAVATTGASVAETTHHLLEGGPAVAAEAIEHALRAAAQAVAVFAFDEATALLDRAQAAIPPDGAALRCRVLVGRAEARIRSGDATGRELCVEAAKIARELGDAGLLALAGLAYGSVLVSLSIDPTMVGLLEEALERLPAADSALRARTMARLAAARQPDPDHLDRDVNLAFEAVAMAKRVGDRRELLAVIHSASGALYGAVEPHIRLSFSREQEQLAEEVGDTTRLLHARVRLAVDYLEMGDFAAYAELARSYEKLAERVGPAAESWRVPLMRSMLALSRDSFEESLRCQEESRRLDSESPRARRAHGFHRIGFLRAAERHAELRASLPELASLWRAMPYGAVLADARVASSLARLGATEELRALLARMPESAFGIIINAAALAEATWLSGDATHAAKLRAMLWPSRARHAMYWFDAEIVEAPSTRLVAYLSGVLGEWEECGRLWNEALQTVEASGRRSLVARMRFELADLLVRFGREPERARALLAEARASAAQLGLTELVALIDARHPAGVSSQTRVPTWSRTFGLALEGEYYAVRSGSRTLRFKATRGMHYLAQLVERPGVDVHVLELAGSSEADRGDAGELLDAQAFRSYRARLEELRDAAEDARVRGDPDRAETLRGEMETIAGELSRATGRGGRAKRADSAVDRARTAVQRRIKDALDRIAEQDPDLGAWLRRAVHTGNYCSFRPSF